MKSDRKPVADLSNRALLEEIATDLRGITGLLAELGPLLELARGLGNGGPPSYVAAAGMRRALRTRREAHAE